MKRLIDVDNVHEFLAEHNSPLLAFDEKADYGAWKKKIKEKFIELTGLDKIAQNSCDLSVQIEEDTITDGYRKIRFTFESEKGSVVPCYLLLPDEGRGKHPLVVVLQGHTSGFHNSLGIAHSQNDKDGLPRNAFAVQAVKNGFAALAIEQRGLGERAPIRQRRIFEQSCTFPAMNALLLGRTIIGERVWDISRAIDCMENFDAVDVSEIVVTGNSGGGTASFYAACYDERISLCVPSCAFCEYKDSIMFMYHCPCNIIPHAYEYFEMSDLACLIAPRKLSAFAGRYDAIFPIEGVKKAFGKAKRIYQKENVEENARLIVTEKDHYWCDDLIWMEICRAIKK